MDLKKLLLEWFDRIAVGLAGLLLLSFLIKSFVEVSPADVRRDKVKSYNREIARKKDLASSRAPKLEPLTAARSVESALTGIPAPETAPGWIFHKRPLIEVKTVGEPIPDPEHHAPQNLQGKGGLGQISISWEENPANQLVRIEGYTVWRAEKSSGEGKSQDWKKVAALEPAAHAYIDRDVESRTQYSYRVDSRATIDTGHPMVKKYGIQLPPEMQVAASAAIGPFETLPDHYVIVQNVITKATKEELAKGIVREASGYLKVLKFFPEEKRWIFSMAESYRTGERVGRKQQIGSKTFDFTTDYVLVETRKEMRKVKASGIEYEREADVAVLRDQKTRQVFELDNLTKSARISEIEKNPTGEGGEVEEESPTGKRGG